MEWFGNGGFGMGRADEGHSTEEAQSIKSPEIGMEEKKRAGIT
jgi:hypothetical protein